MEDKQTESLHSFSLNEFKRSVDALIKTSENTSSSFGYSLSQSVSKTRDYTREQIQGIINSGSLAQQIELSRNYFNKSGFYKRILLHYSTLLLYSGIVVPRLKYGEKLKESQKKNYYEVINFIEDNNLPDLFIPWVTRALRDGCYYGILQEIDGHLISIDLPPSYCATDYKDINGNDLINFNLQYFAKITNETEREAILAAFPNFIQKAFRRYQKKGGSPIIRIPNGVGICLPILDGRPFFLNVINSVIDYEDSVELTKEREEEEIRKIIVQKIPHLNEGTLLFEPDEAVEIHRGTVQMMKGNPNVSVLTTYADVDSIVARTSTESTANFTDSMVNNIYYESGTSGQLFGSNSNLALQTSLRNDLAFTTIFSHKLERIITNVINQKFGKARASYYYSILPVSYHNAEEYLDASFKLAQSGYSFILPVLGLGLSTAKLNALKVVENDVLDLTKNLLPLSSAYTQSSKSADEGGAPRKDTEDKKPHTLETEESLDKQGQNNE